MYDLTTYVAISILEHEKQLGYTKLRPFRQVSEITINSKNGSGRDIIRVPDRFLLLDIVITGYDADMSVYGIAYHLRDLFEIQITSKNSGHKWSNKPEDLTNYSPLSHRAPWIPELFTDDKELELELYHREVSDDPQHTQKITFPALFKVHLVGIQIEK